ncbi:MAG: hypothetical protein ACREB3_05045 [Burkholderiales bacterium]
MANGEGFAPTIGYLRRFAVNRPGQPEVIRQRLYDHLLYPTAGSTQLNFFQTPVGQGITTALGATAAASKSEADTNMRLAGQLPALLNFVMQSIEVTFDPGSVSTANTYTPVKQGIGAGVADAAAAQALLEKGNDPETFYRSGFLKLTIGSKDYLLEAPLGAFPPKTQTIVDAALAESTGTAALAFGNALTLVKTNRAGRPYLVQPNISLMSNQNFVVSLNWPGVVATPSGFNARVGVILDGFTYRASQ